MKKPPYLSFFPLRGGSISAAPLTPSKKKGFAKWVEPEEEKGYGYSISRTVRKGFIH